jgi:hypothetical protein
MLAMALMLNSCKGERHKYIIPRKKFISVLVDIHLADAIGSEILDASPWSTHMVNVFAEPSDANVASSGDTSDAKPVMIDSTSLYLSVFNKHGVTRAQFDSTIKYYSNHPDDFLKIYSEVTARLKIMETELTEATEPEAPPKQTLVWQDTRVKAMPQIRGNSRVAVNIPIRQLGEYTITTKIRLFKDDEAVNPHITLYFWFDNNTVQGNRDNFEVINLVKDGNEYTYSITKRLVDLKVTHLKGYIMDHTNPDTLFRRHFLVSEIKVLRAP